MPEGVRVMEAAATKYGIDTARLFLLFVAAPESELEWSDEGVEGAYRFLKRAFSLVEETESRKPLGSDKDLLIESKRNRAIKLVTQYIESFELNKAIVEIMEFANAIARAKDEVSDAEYKAALSTLAHLLLPFTPHIAEEMHERLGGKGFLSLSVWPQADESRISNRAEADEEYIEETVSNIRKNLQLKGVEKPSSITLYQAQEWKYLFVENFRRLFATVKNPGQITGELLKLPQLAQHKDDVAKLSAAVFKNQKLLPTADRAPDEERTLIERLVKRLEREFCSEVTIGDAATSTDPKARNGLPGKPAVVLA
jgi:leucyl-tRNA synthetase